MSTQSPPEIVVNSMLDAMKNLWLSRAIWAAAELGIADELIDHPKSLDQLAHRFKVNRAALQRLMRALVSEGFFKEGGGSYSNSEKSEGLRSDLPWSMR